MRKAILFFIFCLFLAGCKSKKNIVSVGNIDKNLKIREIVNQHKISFPVFNTLSGSVMASYKDEENAQSVLLSFRMEKDKCIWFSAPLGVAKIYITPEKVSFYNRLDNTFFDGDFSYISKLLGFEVDFNILQNLLLGQSFQEISQMDNYELSNSNSSYYVLKSVIKNPLEHTYRFLPDTYRLDGMDLLYDSHYRVNTQYTYQKIGDVILPNILIINTDSNQKIQISLDFKGLELNKDLNFPFKIPSGMKEIN